MNKTYIDNIAIKPQGIFPMHNCWLSVNGFVFHQRHDPDNSEYEDITTIDKWEAEFFLVQNLCSDLVNLPEFEYCDVRGKVTKKDAQYSFAASKK